MLTMSHFVAKATTVLVVDAEQLLPLDHDGGWMRSSIAKGAGDTATPVRSSVLLKSKKDLGL